jgi:hypothetical protein
MSSNRQGTSVPQIGHSQWAKADVKELDAPEQSGDFPAPSGNWGAEQIAKNNLG